ncbi:GLPGLI family protein [Ancylomarina sp.]|uniref:GLPGLI family protein n=1 Tax=Ancylomarina sp. TaxID=1970196 RepID=UPI00356709A5
MKKLLTTLSILLTCSMAYCQSEVDNHEAIDMAKLQCTYQFSYQMDSTNSKRVRHEKMVLLIGEKCSKYKSYNSIITDSLVRDFDKRGIPPQIVVSDMSIFPKTKFNHQIFKNDPKGSMSVFDRVFKDKFVYNEPLSIFKWEILSDTANVSGYTCQKATTSYRGRNYEAWFTTEIPISDGPYKFNGLPGLIVKIADTKKHYVFELISATKPPMGTLIYIPTYPKTICSSREGFRKAKNDAKQDVIRRLEDMGGHFANPEDRKKAKERAMTKARRTNNPIELM